jgi:hypothetical protein
MCGNCRVVSTEVQHRMPTQSRRYSVSRRIHERLQAFWRCYRLLVFNPCLGPFQNLRQPTSFGVRDGLATIRPEPAKSTFHSGSTSGLVCMDQSIFGIHVDFLRALKGDFFLRKKPLSIVPSVYTNSENAISDANPSGVPSILPQFATIADLVP